VKPAVGWLLRPPTSIAQRARGESNEDSYFGEFFETIAPALELAAIDWPLIDAEHARMLGRPLSARTVTAIETDLTQDNLPTQRISRLSNRLRDEYMLGRLVDALSAHERVFATVGVSHAVMLEPALLVAVNLQPGENSRLRLP